MAESVLAKIMRMRAFPAEPAGRESVRQIYRMLGGLLVANNTKNHT